MANAQLIPAKGDQSVVAVTLVVRVKGEPVTIPTSVPVYGLTVSKEANRIPYAKVLIVDGDAAAQDFEVSNEAWFVPGNPIEIFLGYLNDEVLVFKGVIIKQQLTIRESASFLEVECRDAAYRMTLRRQGRYFEDMADSEVAAELLKAHKIGVDVADTPGKHPELVQYDCTDWDFLVSRMEFNGLLTIVDDGVAHIRPPDFSQEPALHLHHGATVIEFDGGLEVRDQFDAVTARAWNPAEQAAVEITAAEPKIEQNGNLPGKGLAPANGPEPCILRHGGNVREDELKAWAEARLLKDRLSRTVGRVLFQGYNAIKPGQIVALHGFGKRFDGPVYVAAVHQEYLDAGWRTEIEFGLSPKWFAEIVKTEAPRAAGMLPAVSGLQIGVVTQIDEDPEKAHRVRVRLPVLDAGAAGVWARVATLDAGKNRGAFFMPEEDDEVIVGFLHDDPRDAVILGMLHSRDKAPPFPQTRENDEKGFVSRKGIRIVFNEKDGSLLLQTPNGHALQLSDKGQGLLLSDKNGNSIELNEQGITLKSSTNIQIDAKGRCAAKAGADMEIRGSLVKIN